MAIQSHCQIQHSVKVGIPVIRIKKIFPSMSNAMKVKQVIFIHRVYGKTDEIFFFFP